MILRATTPDGVFRATLRTDFPFTPDGANGFVEVEQKQRGRWRLVSAGWWKNGSIVHYDYPPLPPNAARAVCASIVAAHGGAS